MADETESIRYNYPSWRDRAGTPEPTASGYLTARELLREVGDLSADRFFGMVRAARLDADDEAVWPALCRHALHAVALCRRAAELAARR